MNLMSGFSLLLFSTLALAAAAAESTSSNAVPPDHAERLTRGLKRFQTEVRPLLAEHCVRCHGGEKTKGELDLTTREGLLRGGTDGPAVTLYDAGSSRLIRRITHAEEPGMPSKGERLPETDIAHFTAWIDDGAPYDRPLVDGKATSKTDRAAISEQDRQWWAFQPLARVEPPPVPSDAAARTPVDAFIQSRLEAQGLSLNPPADRRILIRRASFDLLGLPPSPEEVDDFVRDRAPDAWPRLVARLLDSPHYGERWARHWLDVARFAESSGFEHDYDRPNAYHFRDFVIQALNSDLPYDQFVRWQLAGDEFEPETPLALMATGFLGAGVFPTQITANEVERTRYDAMDDMLATTGTAFLGMTVGCARCHDHKFDPIPTRDYYRMLSTFTTTVRSDIDLDLDPERTRRNREAFDREHAPRVAARVAYEQRELPPKFDAWLAAGAPLPAPTWELLSPTGMTSKGGASFRRLEDGSNLVEGKNADDDEFIITAEVHTRGLRALRLEALADPSLPHGGPGRADNGNIGLSRIRVFASPLGGGETNEVRLVRPRATFEQNTNSLSIASALDTNSMSGWAVDPRFGTNHAAVFEFADPIGTDGGVRLTVQLEFSLNSRHAIGRPRLSVSSAENPELGGDFLPAAVATLIPGLRNNPTPAPSSLTPPQRSTLLDWWKASDPGWQALQREVESHARQAPQAKLTKVMVCAEGYPAIRMHTQGGDFLPETHFLHRGSTESKRGVATPGFLQVLMRDPSEETRWTWQPPPGAKGSGRRRALANWMTDTDQGAGQLLARVIVNRLWQHHFGQGLVATPNDFGVQGTRPSHPELLDWLASELIRSGWRLKPIHQLLMSSATYQASSHTEPAAVKADPYNQYFGRRMPRRLEAEAVRDSLLSVSGALDPTLYGPGTLDPASRRRSIYFTVKRSQMVAAMQAFDAPEPLSSQGTRPTTTVAPQALYLMNSPQVRTWAESFAARLAPAREIPVSDAVTRAYALAVNRPPLDTERDDALAFIDQQTARHRHAQHPNPQAAALTDFAQVMLSLNEVIYAE